MNERSSEKNISKQQLRNSLRETSDNVNEALRVLELIEMAVAPSPELLANMTPEVAEQLKKMSEDKKRLEKFVSDYSRDVLLLKKLAQRK